MNRIENEELNTLAKTMEDRDPIASTLLFALLGSRVTGLEKKLMETVVEFSLLMILASMMADDPDVKSMMADLRNKTQNN